MFASLGLGLVGRFCRYLHGSPLVCLSGVRLGRQILSVLTQGPEGYEGVTRYEGDYVRCADGYLKIFDGKTTVAAMQELKAIWEDDDLRNLHTWSPALISVMQDGIDCEVVEISYNDPKEVLAYNVLAHDDSMNVYAKTTVKDMVELAREYQSSVPGGKWDATQKALEGALGKRMFAWRCVTAAMTLTDAVLLKMEEVGVANSWILDNKYFVGQGADAKTKRLSDEGRLAVLEQVSEDLLAKKGISSETFQAEYCAVTKHAEDWIQRQQKIFGALCDRPFFKRCKQFLFSNRARPQVYSCMRLRRKLESDAADGPGIEQCRVVVAELQKLKNPTAVDNGLGAASTSAPPGGTLGAAGSSGDGLGAAGSGEGADSCKLGAEYLEMEEIDPVKDEAVKRREKAMEKLQYYESLAELIKCLPLSVRPSQAVILVCEAPTSKLRVNTEALESLKLVTDCLPTQKLLIMTYAGQRLDLLNAIATKTSLLWSPRKILMESRRVCFFSRRGAPRGTEIM